MADALKTLFTDIADAIRTKTGETEAMKPIDFPTKISDISVGGEGSDLVRYVTFMSEDGSTELFKMPVLSGDDCKDPIEHGDIETPTKKSTEAYNYTFSGWAMLAGNPVAVSPLVNVTEDRIVYAAFEESTRYYTVNFYDGETLVDTVQVAYGGTAITNYEKTGYAFEYWTPSNENITQDTDCYGTWSENISFANAGWGTIAEISERGEAEKYFSIGDEKTIELSDGTNMILQIVGFNHDELADGSGKSGITLMTKYLHDCDLFIANSSSIWWGNSASREYCNNTLYNLFPSGLQSVIKEVNKKSQKEDNTLGDTTDKVWLPSITELGITNATVSSVVNGQGDCYSNFFTNNTSRKKCLYRDNSTISAYCTRSRRGAANAVYFISNTGSYRVIYTNQESSMVTLIGLCI